MLKVFPARTQAEKHGQSFTRSSELCEIALRCGHAFGIDRFGVDMVESGGIPYVMDVFSIPGFKSVSDAPVHLAYFYHAAERLARGEPVTEPIVEVPCPSRTLSTARAG